MDCVLNVRMAKKKKVNIKKTFITEWERQQNVLRT